MKPEPAPNDGALLPKLSLRIQMQDLLLNFCLRRGVQRADIEAKVVKHARALSFHVKAFERTERYHDSTLRKAVGKELAGVASLYASLVNAVSRLEQSEVGTRCLEELAVAELLDPDDLEASFQALLTDLQNKADQAARAAGGFEANPRGRPTKQLASTIARLAAVAFQDLTGRRATTSVDPLTSERTGPFVRFLRDVYRLSGVNASPAAMAVKVLNEAKQENEE